MDATVQSKRTYINILDYLRLEKSMFESIMIYFLHLILKNSKPAHKNFKEKQILDSLDRKRKSMHFNKSPFKKMNF